MTDEAYMHMALELAQKGCGRVNPNPMVGAVIVKDGRIIGQGHHQQYGGLHAERNALASCSESPQGAGLFVTLEPCCHWGKTPPCTDAILESGIRRVVIGSADPNPLVAGKGVRTLREHGIAVTENVLRGECDRQNEVFYSEESSVCCAQICHDDGWENRGGFRTFQVDYRGRSTQKSASGPEPICSGSGRCRYGVGR